MSAGIQQNFHNRHIIDAKKLTLFSGRFYMKITGSIYWLIATALISIAIVMEGHIASALYFAGGMIAALAIARGSIAAFLPDKSRGQ